MFRILTSLLLAVGAVTFSATQKKRARSRNYAEIFIAITGPASYTAGGEVLTADQLNQLMPEFGGGLQATAADGFAKIEHFSSELDTVGRQIVYDRATGKLMYFDGGVEIAGATNLSGVTIRCRIVYLLQPTE